MELPPGVQPSIETFPFEFDYGYHSLGSTASISDKTEMSEIPVAY